MPLGCACDPPFNKHSTALCSIGGHGPYGVKVWVGCGKQGYNLLFYAQLLQQRKTRTFNGSTTRTPPWYNSFVGNPFVLARSQLCLYSITERADVWVIQWTTWLLAVTGKGSEVFPLICDVVSVSMRYGRMLEPFERICVMKRENWEPHTVILSILHVHAKRVI